MREKGPSEDTRRVYGTLTDYLRRHSEGPANAPRTYIRPFNSRMDLTYSLVSGYIPCFCTE
jgi:hypothetical protein